MGDFIRYILTGENDLTLALVETGLKEVDSEFALQIDQAATNSADVLHGGEIFGEIEVNQREDQVFSEDIEDLRDELEAVEDGAKANILELLNTATAMIALQLSEEGHDQYRQVDPFWDWLFERYAGVLQIDEEGYYSRDEQLLALD
ncbi:MAG: hypothetical protein GC204_03530 [Chloroflexi bacterium]|nr:hypothetical protein [Chloroflexota bacterium]